MSLIALLIVLIVSALPLATTIGLLLLYRKWRARDGRRSPIANKRIHGAGEQLRKRIEDHGDQIMHGIILIIFSGPYFLAFWALSHVDLQRIRFGLTEAILLAAFLGMTIWAGQRIVVHGNRRRDALQGLKAELYTAQELNRLQAQGCVIFHDVPGEGFNLDHVVVGTACIYAVETKSIRKPRTADGRDNFKVNYDGTRLQFPDFHTEEPIRQARQQSEWLKRHLQQATGLSVPVKPVLALPGWWIEGPIPRDGVRVFNPAGKGGKFMAEARYDTPLDPATIALVAQALAMRHPLESS